MDTLARIRLLTGDDPFWNQQNPTLLKGEVGFRNVGGDDPLMRVGDGVRPWNELPDMNKFGPQGETGPQGPIGPTGATGARGPIGEPGTAEAPWRVPFLVSTVDTDLVVAAFGYDVIQTPPYPIVPASNEQGFCGPYAWWFSPTERWGLPPGGDVIEIHHYWPGRGGTTAGAQLQGRYFSVDGPMGPVFEILPSGAGRLGAHNNDEYQTYSTTMYWAAGSEPMFTLGWGGGVNVVGPPGYTWGIIGGGVFNVWGGCSFQTNTAVPVGYACYISNNAGYVMPGQTAVNGLRIGAGWDFSDKPLRVCNSGDANSGQAVTLFEIRGDGAIIANPHRVTSGPFAVWFMTDGQIAVQSSSARYKANIRTAARARARELVSQLRLVNFTSLCRDEDPSALRYGLIAEEVEAIDPALVGYDKQGRPEGVNYQAVTLLLLPLVQELLGMPEPTGETYG